MVVSLIALTTALFTWVGGLKALIPDPNLYFLEQGWQLKQMPINSKHQVAAFFVVNTEDASQEADLEIRGYNKNTKTWYTMPDCDVVEPGVEYELACPFKSGVIIVEDLQEPLDMRELGDIDNDGIVGIKDLNILKAYYGKVLR